MDQMIDMTYGDLLTKIAGTYPDKLAVKYTDRDYHRTYKEFDEECDRVARGLMAIGVKKGDHVAMWASNTPEWMIGLFACMKIGAIFVTVNTGYKIFELEYLLRQSDSTTLILMDSYKGTDYKQIINELIPMLKDAKPGKLDDSSLPYLKNIIYTGDQDFPGTFHFSELYTHADQVSVDKLEAAKKTLNPHDVINMQYTSGTTGFPKGVMLTHYNIINDGKSIGDCMDFSEQDILCIPVPFFHCFGLVLAITACVTHGCGMVPIDVFKPDMVMQAIQDEKCTAVHGVPTMFIAMLEHPDFAKYDLSSLRTGIMAGSPCPVKVMEQVVHEMGCRDITIAYGLTEASPVCTQTTTQDSIEVRVNTIGRALPGVECKIVDPETGETLPPNHPGEFCARGYNIMKGYYNMPEATAQAIDKDGWLHSGDIAVMDENGYYKITGRMKDMIIRGGENIYPKEIEDFFYTHPQIKDVQVIGVPSEKYGEEIMACIILREDATLSEDDVITFARKNIAWHKAPRYVWFMEEFPMTTSGKIQKYKLREAAIKHAGLESISNIETA